MSIVFLINMTTISPAPAKGVKGWAIVAMVNDGDKMLLTSSVRGSKYECLRDYAFKMYGGQYATSYAWKKLYRLGDRCIPVLITPAQ